MSLATIAQMHQSSLGAGQACYACRMHVEEKELTIRLELRASFPEEYEGDDDGRAWTQEVPALAAQLLAAVVTTIQRDGRWRVRPANRGRSTEDELMLVLERTFG